MVNDRKVAGEAVPSDDFMIIIATMPVMKGIRTG
jgi:hypothetical protein